MRFAARGFASATKSSATLAGRRGCRTIGFAAAARAFLLAAAGVVPAAAAAILNLRCTNPASGASWSIAIDLDRGRVGPLTATVTDRWISWRDPNRGFFELERATGRLRLRNASSTGGYFLYYACRPE
jgi:hypothetical protein